MMNKKEYPYDETLEGLILMIKEDKDLLDALFIYIGDDDTENQELNK